MSKFIKETDIQADIKFPQVESEEMRRVLRVLEDWIKNAYNIFINTEEVYQIDTGMILQYGNATPPAGYLDCDGSAVSRTTYADLFAVTSTTYGAGDGSTTFNLPTLTSGTDYFIIKT